MLHLPDVALILVDTVCPELAAVAITRSCSKVRFGSVHIWANSLDHWWGCFPYQKEAHVRPCTATCFNDVSQLIWETVPKYVGSKYILIQHWDSWVLDPDAWDDNFLTYDYLGAPWGWHNDDKEVGNGGFSLRSMRLVKKVGSSGLWRHWGMPEDAAVCRINRHLLEPEFSFAPVPLAAKFSFERTHYQGPGKHFGFHGVFNFPRVLHPVELESAIQQIKSNDYLKNKLEVQELLALDTKPSTGLA